MKVTLKKALEYYQNQEFKNSKKICIEILDNDPNDFDANNLSKLRIFKRD